MKLSQNFTLKELLKSNTASRRGIDEQFNPPNEIVFNLKLLTREILQPVRTFLETGVRITSGYRCEALNKAVGGSKPSAHRVGRAADIEGFDESIQLYIAKVDCGTQGKEIIELRDRISDDTHIVSINGAILLFIAYNLEGLFDQLISEYGHPTNPGWCHVGISRVGDNPRGQIFRKVRGKPYTSLTKQGLWNQITG